MPFDTELTIDLEEVKEYIESNKFTRFLLDTAPSFETAAFVLQSLLNAVDDAKQSLDKEENI